MTENPFERSKKMRQIFTKNINSVSLTNLVMSEIRSPIEDYPEIIHLVEDHLDIIEDVRLLYIAAYLCSEWTNEDNIALSVLNDNIAKMKDSDKAIVCYLNANHILCRNGTTVHIRSLLEQSVKHSKNMSFAQNRYELSKFLDRDEASTMLRLSACNVREVLTMEKISMKSDEYWLDIQNWINEYILGIVISDTVFKDKYGNQFLPAP